MRQKNYERNLKIVKLREEGETFAAIGKRFNLTKGRAQQIYHEMLRIGAKDLIEKATDITNLSMDTRRAMDRATGIENCSLIDFQNFVRDNPKWRREMPSYDVIAELEDFCSENGILLEKDLYSLGLDTRACNGISRRIEKEHPMLSDLKEILKDPEWRHNLLQVPKTGMVSIRRLEKFALEQGLLDEPENVLGMGLSSEAVVAIAPVKPNKDNYEMCVRPITLEDVKKVITSRWKNDSEEMYVYRKTPKKIVEEIRAFAREHNLMPEK